MPRIVQSPLAREDPFCGPGALLEVHEHRVEHRPPTLSK
jgi:hypothetical protein